MRRLTKATAVLGAVALVLAASGCAKKDSTDTAGDKGNKDCVKKDPKKKVGMAFDVGGRGD